MAVKAYDPFLTPEQIRSCGAEPAEQLSDVFNSEFVSLHIPLTTETRESVNKSLLACMPKNGVLINTARQEVVNEADLLSELLQRPGLGYLADVIPSNLQAMKDGLGEVRFKQQVFVTPKKTGAQTNEANNNCAPAAARQIVAFFENGDKKFQVNK